MTVSPDINLAEMLLDFKAAVPKQMPELNTACSRIPPQPCETLIKSDRKHLLQIIAAKSDSLSYWLVACIQFFSEMHTVLKTLFFARLYTKCRCTAVSFGNLVCPLHVRIPRLIRVVVKFPSPTPCCPSPTDDVTPDCVNTPNYFHKCDVTSLYLYTYKGVFALFCQLYKV